MNYTALIENRKSVRAFRSKEVPEADVEALRRYYETGCQRLVPLSATELMVLGTEARTALEGSAGYEDFLVGAPRYLVLLTQDHPQAVENAGYMMEDLLLKLQELGIDSCWLTFADEAKVRQALDLHSDRKIAAMAAFGYGEKTAKRMRLNIFSMSNLDISAKRGYYSHKKDINEIAFVGSYGCTQGLDEVVGFYDDMLWQALYAAAQTPSYLNRQPFAFLLKDQDVVLVRTPDPYTDDVSARLDLGIAMLHFGVVAAQWMGKVRWDFDSVPALELPEGCSAAAVYHM